MLDEFAAAQIRHVRVDRLLLSIVQGGQHHLGMWTSNSGGGVGIDQLAEPRLLQERV